MRAYDFRSIINRRIRYIYYLFTNQEIFNFHSQALTEMERCLVDRGLSSHAIQMRHLCKDIANGKRILPRICISVTNQCTLKCIECNDLMPYCKKRYYEQIDNIKHDIGVLLSAFDRIINVELIGGEPFLYKDLSNLVGAISSDDKIDWIEITTNGTILPSQEDIHKLKNKKLMIKLSDYGGVNHNKISQMYCIAKKEGIIVRSLQNRWWIKSGGVERRKRPRFHVKYNYYNCHARADCKVLYKGNLYTCGRAPVLYEIERLKDNNSYIDIRNSQGGDSLYRIVDEFYHRDYASCCEYCDYSDDSVECIPSGEQGVGI